MRQNKGSILKATVEYVKALKEDQIRIRHLEEKLKFQEFQHRKLLGMIQVGSDDAHNSSDKCNSDLI